MMLGFKEKYTDRTPSNFKEKIMAGVPRLQSENIDFAPKIHSLREDRFDRWKAGNSIQMAYHVRSKQCHIFNADVPELATCKSTQKIFMTLTWCLEISINGCELIPEQIEQLIKNDGLSRYQFIQWFFQIIS